MCARHVTKRDWTEQRNSAPPSEHKLRVLATVVIFNMSRKLQTLCDALFLTDDDEKTLSAISPLHEH